MKRVDEVGKVSMFRRTLIWNWAAVSTIKVGLGDGMYSSEIPLLAKGFQPRGDFNWSGAKLLP